MGPTKRSHESTDWRTWVELLRMHLLQSHPLSCDSNLSPAAWTLVHLVADPNPRRSILNHARGWQFPLSRNISIALFDIVVVEVFLCRQSTFLIQTLRQIMAASLRSLNSDPYISNPKIRTSYKGCLFSEQAFGGVPVAEIRSVVVGGCVPHRMNHISTE